MAVLMARKPAGVKHPFWPMQAASPAPVAPTGGEAVEDSGLTSPGGPLKDRETCRERWCSRPSFPGKPSHRSILVERQVKGEPTKETF